MIFRKYIFWFFILNVIHPLCGCNEVESTPELLLVKENSLMFWPEGGQKSIQVQSNGEFLVEVSDSWCRASKDSIVLEKLNITVEENDEIGEERNTSILLRHGDLEQVINVKQLAHEPYLYTDSEKIFLNDDQGLSFSIEIETNVEFQFDLPEWIIHVSNDDPIIGNHSYQFKALPLDDLSEVRQGEISIVLNNKIGKTEKRIIVDQRNSESNFKVGTYNIYVGNWVDIRKELVYEILRKNDFDIFGTQEGTINHLKDIEDDFSVYEYIGTGRDGGESGEFSAIFYKKDLFELLDQGDFWYSKTPDEPSYGWDAINYRRICSWGKFRDRKTNKIFYFFNSHYDHQGVEARKESSKLLLEKMKNIREEDGIPMFSVGDFNAGPEAKSIKILLNDGLLLDSRELSLQAPFGPYGTFQGFDANLNSENRIDYILVTEGIAVKTYGVIDDRIDGQCPSDHDPVVVEINF